jgi:hypothetical protein
MKKTLSFPKGLANRQAVLYSLQLRLAENEYALSETPESFVIELTDVSEKDANAFRNEVLFNALRFEIAERNRDLRRDIIAKALGGANYGK